VASLSMLGLATPGEAGGQTERPTYVIAQHGASGDGRTLNTEAIQAVIDRCSRGGGGDVVVPAGTFLTGALFLKPGVHLRIEKGGVLLGSVEPRDYPQVATRWEGEEREWTAALINAVGLEDVAITGEGVIDGSGDEWLKRYPRFGPPQPSAQSPVPSSTPRAVLQTGKPRLICLQDCRRVRVAGLTLRNQAVWCLHVLYSEDVDLSDLVIRAAHDIPSSDGIDVDSSRRVRIVRCDIDVNDDCISIKSGKDADGLRVNRPSEDILIEDCHFRYGHGGVAMGSETSGGIRRVQVRRCVVDSGNWAPIRFKTQPSRGGVVEDILYSDITLADTRQAFEFNMLWRMVPPLAPPAKVLPVVRDVRLVNISGQVGSLGVVRGLPDSPIRGVRFENCRVKARQGLILENVEDVDLSGLRAEVAEGAAIIRKTAAPTPTVQR
jgi:exo-poly-alpha-galacturonosidase